MRIKRSIEEQTKKFNEDCELKKEEMSLINEISMMQSECTPNEIIEDEIELIGRDIERMKRDRVVMIHD